MRLARRFIAFNLVATCMTLVGCKDAGPPFDLFTLDMSQTAGDILDTAHDTLLPGTDTVINPGTLNIKVTPVDRFLIAGVPFPPQEQFDGPSLRILLYSDDVMTTLANRITDGVGGGQFRTFETLVSGDVDAQVVALGADPRIIGVTVAYFGETSFLDDVQDALTERLGPGTAIDHLDDGVFWKDADRYILITPDYGSIRILAASQVYKGCLLLGPPGVVDVGGCDRNVFLANLTEAIRTAPDQ